jgi:hypothetical protein
MKIKIIKRTDGTPKAPVTAKAKPKRKQTIESTIQNWIAERRENHDTEDRRRNSQFAAFNTEVLLTEAV